MLKVDKVYRVALAPYTLATKSLVSATVDFVADVYRALGHIYLAIKHRPNVVDCVPKM